MTVKPRGPSASEVTADLVSATGRLIEAGDDTSLVMPELMAVARAHTRYQVTADVFRVSEILTNQAYPRCA